MSIPLHERYSWLWSIVHPLDNEDITQVEKCVAVLEQSITHEDKVIAKVMRKVIAFVREDGWFKDYKENG